MTDLVFDVIALDKAAQTFIALAEHVDKFSEKLDRLDGKDADVGIQVHDEEANRKLDELDAKTKTIADGTMSRWQMIASAVAAGLVAFGPAAAGLIVAGLGAAFIGVAAIAEHSNEDIQSSFTQMKDELSSGFEEWASSTVPHMTQAMDEFRNNIDLLGPSWTQVFDNVGPSIEILGHGLTELVSNLMPGLVASTSNLNPVMEGFASLLGKAGTGLSDLLTAWSTYGSEFGLGLQTFGTTVEDVFGLLSNLVVDLTQAWGQYSGQIVTFFQELSNVISGLSNGALAVFGQSLSAVFDVVNGLLIAIGPLASTLGGLAVVATDGFLAFKAYQAVSGWFDDAATKLGKFNSGLGNFASAAAGPVGIAIGALILALGLLGSAHADAAQKAQQQEQRENDLADALRKSGGVIDDNVRQLEAKQLAEFKAGDETVNLLEQTRKLLGPDALPSLTLAYEGNSDAGKTLTTSLDALVKQHTQFVTNGRTSIPVLDDTGKAAKSLSDIISGNVSPAFGDAAQKNRDFASATSAAHTTLSPLDQALKTLATTESTTKEKTTALTNALEILIGDNISAAQAGDSFQKAVLNLSKELDKGKATLVGNSLAAVTNRLSVEAAGNAAIQHAEAVFKQTGNLGAAKEALKQDEQALFDNMNKTYGNRDSVNHLLDSLGLLPGQADQALGGMQRFANDTTNSLNSIPNRSISVTAYGKWSESYSSFLGADNGQAPGGVLPLGANPHATGGPIYGFGGETDDMIPAWLSNNEYVVRASAHRKYGTDFLDSVNNGSFPGFANGGSVGMTSATGIGDLITGLNHWLDQHVSSFGNQIAGDFQRLVSSAGGGNAGQWAPLVLSALSMLGQSASLLPNVLRRMNQESGGNPYSVNTWDANALAGHPSMGLMQTIPSTFAAYAGPFGGRGIFDPMANIYAGLNYAIHNYPSLRYAMDKPGGYKNGGWLYPGQLGYNETSEPEAILNKDQLGALMQTRSTKHVTVNVYARTVDADDIVNAVQRVEGLYF